MKISGQESGKATPKPQLTKMDEQSCKENMIKSYECAGIHNHRKEVAPNSQDTKELVCSRDRWSAEFLVEKV